ncbi:MAG: hypothetical protein ABH804_02200 [archaeon]
MEEYNTLSQICSSYKYVLIDTCSISGCYEKDLPPSKNMQFALYIKKEMLDGSRLLATKGVLGEIKNINSRKNIRYEENSFRKFAYVMTGIREYFIQNSRIISLNNSKEYKSHRKRLRNHVLFSEASENDFTFFLTGYILFKRKNKVALISNDNHILIPWMQFNSNSWIEPERFKAFKRVGINDYLSALG